MERRKETPARSREGKVFAKETGSWVDRKDYEQTIKRTRNASMSEKEWTRKQQGGTKLLTTR